MADVGGVDLELHPHDEPLAGVDAVVAEHDAPVAAGLADRRGLGRVELHALDPALVEDEPRMRDGAPRADLDARLEEQPAPHRLRRGDAQRPPRACAPRSASCPARRRRAGRAPRSRRRSSAPRGAPTARRSRPAARDRGDVGEQLRHPESIRGRTEASFVVAPAPCPPLRSTSRPTSTTTCSARRSARSSCGAPPRENQGSELGAFLDRPGRGDRGRPRDAPGDHGRARRQARSRSRWRPAGPPRSSGA